MAEFTVDPNAVASGNVYNTIQAAINNAADGDTIVVVAGTYNEDLLIDKAVTIQGAQSGVAGANGGRDAASGAGETTIIGNSRITATDAVTVDGLRFVNDATTTDGGPSNPTLWIANGAGHVVENSIFWSDVAGGATGVDDRAIGMPPIAGGSITIADNYIGGDGGKYGDASWGRGIWSDGGGVALTVEGNAFESTRTSINLDAFDPTKVIIDGNEFRLAGTALSIGTPTSSTIGGIENNVFGNTDTDLNLKNVTIGMTVDLSTTGNTSTGGTFYVDGPLGATTFIGGATDDAYFGRAAADNVNTGAGNDYIFASAGGDKIDGGDGNDTLDMSAAGSGGSFVDLSSGLAFSSATGIIGISGIENVKGSAGNDGLFGDGADNIFHATAGSDTIDGRGGTDTFDASAATGAVNIDLAKGSATGSISASLASIENAKGGSGDDHFTGTAGNNTFSGGAGVDTYHVSDKAGDIKWNVDHFEATTGAGGTDVLNGVEKAEFDDGTVWLVHNSAELTNALASAGSGDKVLLASGNYTGNFAVAADNVTIESATGNAADVVFTGTFKTDNDIGSAYVSDWVKTATSYTTAAGSGFTVTGDNVEIKNITITGYSSAVGLATSDGLTLSGLVLDDNLFGIYNNGSASAVTNFSLIGGKISHSLEGLAFDAVAGSEFSDVLIQGTTFEHLTWKGIYVERLQDAELIDIIMSDVGQFGRIPTYGGSGPGADGSGIELNLKYGDYSNIRIENPTLTNVGLSNGSGSPHFNGAAIAIKARSDAPSYNSNPATLDGVTIVGGSIIGTSTGIRIGEPNKSQNGPTNVSVDGVDISGAVTGEYDNRSNAVLTVTLSNGNDNVSTNPDATGPIAYSALDGNDNVAGGKGNDTLLGGDGNDTLAGGLGADTLEGGKGDDVYVADASDTITEAADGGTDTVESAGTITLAGNIENLTLTGSANADGTGNGEANVIKGNSGNNTLSGLVGNDALHGGAGTDTLNGGDDDDLLDGGEGADNLNGGDGIDTASYANSQSAVSVNLGGASSGGDATGDTFNSVENLVGSTFGDILVGDTGDNGIDGGLGGDFLFGGGGTDTLSYRNSAAGVSVNLMTGIGSGGDAQGDFVFEFERIVGSGFGDVLVGNSAANTLSGMDGDDQLDGGTGGDTLAGGLGDDSYVVDDMGDVIQEGAGEGDDDHVAASASYKLTAGAHVERLTTIAAGATTAIDLTGNALSQEITGNAGANVFHEGGAGAADVLRGLEGNDTYRIFNSGAVIVETAGQGDLDKVNTAVSYALGADVHVEVLQTNGSTGTGAINLTGNALKQEIIGNAGSNVLHDGGKGEVDTLRGFGGNDTYRIFNSGDVIVETATQGDADKVNAAVDYALGNGVYIEILQTNGTTGTSGIDLTGNEIAQSIIGNAGSNILDGKGGNDTLTGLAGKDYFVFSSALGAGNVDTITDFNVADDTIRLENAVFTALATTGTFAASAFRTNATGEAEASNDRIIYEADTGRLFYDADGAGGEAGVHFATLTSGLSLTNADFVVI
ncbi:beta strand repeat-containing protein [Kumtagia ephedrae]|uniref:Calcium-binding protein n=1 Tax=Kumtagia ephedrae TaxID=2116701 RepID=A0A2P7S0Y6_9HYPH|nr:hypothetical protein [Mesorhizobium ephedrae]PSJ56131.1 hypothetical protein C7I84_21400 [Mesorhizobium ephedrae]